MSTNGPDSSEGSTGDVKPGDVIAGKYRIERVLGAGGMGVVVAAHHIHLDERVAIKFLLPEAAARPEAVARFTREARAAIKIKSSHVARVIDVATLESGAPYMVMEYLDGQDLSALLVQRGPQPVTEAVDFVIQACDAIAEAHGLGIIHRDLKPANLFCVRGADGLLSVRVLDFGISKVTSTTAGELDMTRTSTVMGSPVYMSPEQLTSAKNVDARTDIWSLGVVLYELVAGQLPFQGETLSEVSINIATQQPPSLRQSRPDLPDGLEAVVLKCLEKDRSRRYQNVAELAGDLVRFGPAHASLSAGRISRIVHASLRSQETLESVSSSGVQSSAAAPAETAPPWGTSDALPEPATRRRSKVGLALLAAAAVVVVVGAGALVVRTRSKPAFSAHSEAPTAVAAPSTPATLPEAPTLSSTASAEAVSSAVASASASAPIPSVAPAESSTSHPATPAAKPPQRSTRTTRAHRTHASHAAVDCNPPYTIAPNGNHIYKPQCL